MKKNLSYCPTVNLDKVWALLPKDALEEAKKDTSKATVIDVTQHGIFKVLGKGVLPKVPVVLKAKFFTKLAERKVKAVGGACVLTC